MMRLATHTDPAAERARQALVRRRKALLATDDERNYALSSPGRSARLDPVERQEENEAAAALGVLTLEEQRELQDVDDALDRIGKGQWGLCQACGHAIGHQLLRAVPERRLCLACELK